MMETKKYRKYSQTEVDLMQRISIHADATKELIDRIEEIRMSSTDPLLGQDTLDDFVRCAELAKDNLQTGFMWLKRSITLPETFE